MPKKPKYNYNIDLIQEMQNNGMSVIKISEKLGYCKVSCQGWLNRNFDKTIKYSKKEDKIYNLEKPNQNAIQDFQVYLHRNAKIFKKFRNAFFAVVVILCLVGFYLWVSKPITPILIVWPEYDHTQPFNPYSDNNPVDSIAVGNPVLGGGAVSNPSKPTPFPGMDY